MRALTRDPQKPAARTLAARGAEVVRGDFDEPKSLTPALKDVSGVFSMQNFWETGYDREVRQGVALADVAADTGVQHFVYSSVGSAHRKTGLSHFESKWEIEEHIRASDLPYTIFRPVFFMENWGIPSLRDPILNGTLLQPLDPDVPLQQIAVDDIGAFVAMAFAEPDAWRGRELDLAGDSLTMPQIAAAFSRALDQPVAYVQVPWDQFREGAGEEWERMSRWFNDVGYEADIPALRKIYPQLTTFEQYLRSPAWHVSAERAPAPERSRGESTAPDAPGAAP